MSSPPRRSAALTAGALAVALAAALLAGCQSAASDSGERRPVTEELSILISAQNQLYYPPFLREEPTGPQDNAYAQRTRALLGTPPRLDLNHKTAEFLRQDALGSSPLWGRGWLAPLAASGADGLLNDRDAADVRRMRTADGWYRTPLPPRAARSQPTEPAGQQAKNAYRAAATATALEILRAHGGITEADRRATLPWLRKAAAHPGTLSESADLAQALRLLNAPVPARLAAVTPPKAAEFTSLGGKERYQALLDAYQYARLRESAGQKAELDPEVWGTVLSRNAATFSYPDLYYATFVAKAAGAPAAALDKARDRIRANTLPGGAVRDPGGYLGSPEASFYALLLRGLAGEPTHDDRLAKALGKVASDPRAAGDPATRLTTAAAAGLAGAGRRATSAASALCRSAQVVPRTVTAHSAEKWARTALACDRAGAPAQAPRTTPWPLNDAERVTAAATLATGLADTGQPPRPARWVTAHQLRPWATDPKRLGSVSGYATVVRAYLLAGGKADAPLREAVARGIDARRGCPRLPSLYQADAEGGCDLKATWHVWQLKKQLKEQNGTQEPKQNGTQGGKQNPAETDHRQEADG
ncbi:hypothetical protein SBI_04605 [Streptomyces bingchenggensis BCW-1]|uniref:Lipoprotein n=2 Tax=Streptomyces TaxID=1883 RepID=D7BXF2_STRBB|nr:hypothetical protein [Streptomyces bingchenggensis]ADI07725.1 hypothetical protein SBI_04605 [Streptomyces bingchenggensis BCW-1]